MDQEKKQQARIAVNKELQVLEEYDLADGLRFLVSGEPDFPQRFEALYSELSKADLWPKAWTSGNVAYVGVLEAPTRRERRSWLYLALLLATVASVLASGYGLAIEYYSAMGLNPTPLDLASGSFQFLLGLLGILGTHELGHKWASERARRRASWPYFIPGPPFIPGSALLGIGTFGAVIISEEPPLTKDQLFELGASGPLAGFVMSLLVGLAGVLTSPPAPLLTVERATTTSYGIFYYLPPVLSLLFYLRGQQASSSALSPLLVASWIGMLVTFLNVLPAAQLDGGHVFRSFLSRRGMLVVTLASILIMASFGFWLMAIIVALMAAFPDPGPLNEVTPLSQRKYFVLAVLIAVGVLTAVALPRPQVCEQPAPRDFTVRRATAERAYRPRQVTDADEPAPHQLRCRGS